MGRAGRIAAALVFGVLAGWTDAAAEPLNPLTVHVLILDGVGVEADTLRQAQEEAQRIFKAATITLAWRLRDQEPPAGSLLIKLVIKIVANPIGESGKNPNVLAMTPGSKEARGTVAYLFYHRIHNLGQLLQLEVSQLLGHVMAHEMGHLLLPYGSHAVSGIMMAGWGTQQSRLASEHSLTFEPSQAALIRARLSQRR